MKQTNKQTNPFGHMVTLTSSGLLTQRILRYRQHTQPNIGNNSRRKYTFLLFFLEKYQSYIQTTLILTKTFLRLVSSKCFSFLSCHIRCFINMFWNRVGNPMDINCSHRLVPLFVGSRLSLIFQLWIFNLYIATFRWHLHMEYIFLKRYGITEFEFPIGILLIENRC